MKAWHWCSNDMRTSHTDEPIVVGEKLTVEGPIKLCKRGLHASEDILDALWYAPGAIVCRVKLSGRIDKGGDKLVASERLVEWCVDATDILVQWARECADRVADTDEDTNAAADYAFLANNTTDRDSFLVAAAVCAADAACDAAAARAAVGNARYDARKEEKNWQRNRLLRLIEEKRTK